MTKVPTALLPDTITVEPYQGAGAYGPVYAAAVQIRARVEGRRRTVRRADGTDLISSATAIIRPGTEVATESRVTHEDRTYEVVDVLIGEGLRRPAYYELVLS